MRSSRSVLLAAVELICFYAHVHAPAQALYVREKGRGKTGRKDEAGRRRRHEKDKHGFLQPCREWTRSM